MDALYAELSPFAKFIDFAVFASRHVEGPLKAVLPAGKICFEKYFSLKTCKRPVCGVLDTWKCMYMYMTKSLLSGKY